MNTFYVLDTSVPLDEIEIEEIDIEEELGINASELVLTHDKEYFKNGLIHWSEQNTTLFYKCKEDAKQMYLSLLQEQIDKYTKRKIEIENI